MIESYDTERKQLNDDLLQVRKALEASENAVKNSVEAYEALQRESQAEKETANIALEEAKLEIQKLLESRNVLEIQKNSEIDRLNAFVEEKNQLVLSGERRVQEINIELEQVKEEKDRYMNKVTLLEGELQKLSERHQRMKDAYISSVEKNKESIKALKQNLENAREAQARAEETVDAEKRIARERAVGVAEKVREQVKKEYDNDLLEQQRIWAEAGDRVSREAQEAKERAERAEEKAKRLEATFQAATESAKAREESRINEANAGCKVTLPISFWTTDSKSILKQWNRASNGFLVFNRKKHD